MTEMKEHLAKYSSLLPVAGSISIPEAERRAGEFLMAMATIAEWRHVLSEDKIKLLSVQTAIYSEQMSLGKAKTVTENKLTAEASKEYTQAREELERIENDISYLKAYYEIMINGHIFYRGLAKDNGQ